MGCFGGESVKRHVVWSNDYEFIDGLIAAGGFLSAAARQALSGRALASHARDPKTGKKTFTGIRKRLKDSQSLSLVLAGVCFANHSIQLFASCLVLLVYAQVRRYTRQFGRTVAHYFKTACERDAPCLTFRLASAFSNEHGE